eukprot:PhM_4_TR1288/c2_g2_i2/m.7491
MAAISDELRSRITSIRAHYAAPEVVECFGGEDGAKQRCQDTIDAILRDSFKSAPVQTEADKANIELAKIMRLQNEQAVRPWSTMMQQFLETQKLMTTRSFEQLRGQFLNAAKTHALPAWKAIIGTYVLYSDEDERRTFMSFLLSARTMEELVVQHNLHVTNRMADNEAFLAAHHRTLATMTTPLMPPLPDFSTINLTIVQDTANARDDVAGAGPVAKNKQVAAYSNVSQRGFDVNVSVSGGEPLFPVRQLPNGTLALDMQSPSRTHAMSMPSCNTCRLAMTICRSSSARASKITTISTNAADVAAGEVDAAATSHSRNSSNNRRVPASSNRQTARSCFL